MTDNSLFPMRFEDNGSVIAVIDGDNNATRVSPFEISPSRVLYQSQVSCLTELAGRRRRNRRDSEYNEESEPELVERELAFLIYVTQGSRGWGHIPKSGRVQIDQSKLLVAPGVQYPLALTTKMLDAFRKGEFDIDPVDMFSIVNAFQQNRIDFSGTDQGIVRFSEICSIWAIGTHFHQAFRTFPFIKYEGPSGCGKTTANWTTASICFHPIPTPDLSDPSLYRLREATNGTIAMDERDFKKKTESRLDDFLNSGFTKGGFVFRNVKDELGNIVPTPFSVYGPFSFSGVQDLPYMTETRTLIIPMRRTLLKRFSGTLATPFDVEATRIRDMLYLCRFLFGMKIAELYEALNVEDFDLDTRAWDLARPLIAVASLFAPDTIPSIIAYVNSQVREREGEATDRGEIKVLLALSEIVKLKQTETETLKLEAPAYNLPIEFPLGLTAIRNQILEMFTDENKDWWTNRRIAKSLRQLGFLKKSRSGSRGEFQYFITIHGVHDWVSRLRLTEDHELTEHTSTSICSVPSDVQLLSVKTTEAECSVENLSSVEKTEQTEGPEVTERTGSQETQAESFVNGLNRGLQGGNSK